MVTGVYTVASGARLAPHSILGHAALNHTALQARGVAWRSVLIIFLFTINCLCSELLYYASRD